MTARTVWCPIVKKWAFESLLHLFEKIKKKKAKSCTMIQVPYFSEFDILIITYSYQFKLTWLTNWAISILFSCLGPHIIKVVKNRVYDLIVLQEVYSSSSLGQGPDRGAWWESIRVKDGTNHWITSRLAAELQVDVSW